MNEVIAKLQEVLDLGIAKTNELSDKIAKVDAALADIQVVSGQLSEQKKQLEAREAAVKSVENIDAVTKQNALDKKQLREDQENLAKERKAFIDYMEQSKNEILAEKHRQGEAAERLEVKQIALESAIAKLEEDRKNMKADIIKKMSEGK